jgi:arsenate reductase
MIIFGLKNCDTCRKAKKALVDATLQDVRADGLPDDVRDAALAQFGERLLNTRSTTWRGLSEEERAQTPQALLAAHPALMKRPLIVADGQMYLGWNAQTQADLGV